MADTNQTAAQKIRAWREKKGVTQAEAAALVGVHQSKWCRWEAETHTPSAAEALRMHAVSGGLLPVSIWGDRPTPKKRARAGKAA